MAGMGPGDLRIGDCIMLFNELDTQRKYQDDIVKMISSKLSNLKNWRLSMDETYINNGEVTFHLYQKSTEENPSDNQVNITTQGFSDADQLLDFDVICKSSKDSDILDTPTFEISTKEDRKSMRELLDVLDTMEVKADAIFHNYNK